MMRGARFLAFFAVAIAIAACEVETETFLSYPAADRSDERLSGDWYRSDGTNFAFLSIRADAQRPGVLYVVYAGLETSHARIATFRAWPARIGEHDHYLNLEKLHGLGAWMANRTILRYQIAADGSMRFRWMQARTIEQAIKSGRLAGRLRDPDKGILTTITEGRDRLLAFIPAAGPDALFTEADESESWRRLKRKSVEPDQEEWPKGAPLITESFLSEPDGAGYDARLVGERYLSLGDDLVGVIFVRPEDPRRPGALRITLVYVCHGAWIKGPPLEPFDVLAFRAWRTSIDGRDYLNVESLYGALVPRRWIVGYEIAADGAFHVRLADKAILEAAIQSGELAVDERGDWSPISASREALRTFISAKGSALWRGRLGEIWPLLPLPPTNSAEAPKR